MLNYRFKDLKSLVSTDTITWMLKTVRGSSPKSNWSEIPFKHPQHSSPCDHNWSTRTKLFLGQASMAYFLCVIRRKKGWNMRQLWAQVSSCLSAYTCMLVQGHTAHAGKSSTFIFWHVGRFEIGHIFCLTCSLEPFRPRPRSCSKVFVCSTYV